MKRLFLSGLFFMGLLFGGRGQSPQPITDFEIIRNLVDSNRFEMQYTIATTHHSFYLQPTTPYSDQNIRIARDSAFIIIRDSIAAGYLPYFGSGYATPQTGKRGIIFSNPMEQLICQYRGKGKRKSIFYQFSVVGQNDTYKINIDIRHDGTCYLFINSLKRSPVSYTGQIVEKVK